jgi:hypothetical protein
MASACIAGTEESIAGSVCHQPSSTLTKQPTRASHDRTTQRLTIAIRSMTPMRHSRSIHPVRATTIRPRPTRGPVRSPVRICIMRHRRTGPGLGVDLIYVSTSQRIRHCKPWPRISMSGKWPFVVVVVRTDHFDICSSSVIGRLWSAVSLLTIWAVFMLRVAGWSRQRWTTTWRKGVGRSVVSPTFCCSLLWRLAQNVPRRQIASDDVCRL